jgi:TolB-like protein/class 3 adenylate cyclase/Tfp pilus assembly protein PilF
MSAEVKKELHLEIAHVLFMDVVGFSKLLINDQTEILEQLNQLVRETPHFREAEAAGKLIRLSTGDGMALVFSNSAEAPVECALEISKALKSYPQIQLRMGVHSGPINAVRDVNDRLNVTGAGINMAQRVMDCGDAGHTLLSKHVAEDLEQYRQWQPCLHGLGECEVKHGMRIGVVNLYTDEVGNAQLPKKFQALKKRGTRVRWTAIAAALLALAVIVGGIAMFSRYGVRSMLTAPEKSIAVLPFENLSEDKANAYFADGIQEEILTRLAKIADLKVISRTSTQRYQSKPGNLGEIAKQLGVANILEGSVQKAADQVRVNVQLINAQTDSHLWADTYDRKLTDIFGVESEIAKGIAEALQAKLTGREEQALAVKPTNNPEAYDAYLRGLAYSLRPSVYEADTLNAAKYFGEAVKLDPKFALAWASLAHESALGYFNHAGSDVPSLRETAKHAASKAIELQPDLGEAYLAQGYFQYYCERDYDSAIASFEKAQHLSPKNSQILEALGLIWRRKGEWQRSLEYFRQASELDPRDISLLSQQADALAELRQYSAALKVLDRDLEISPDNADVLASKAEIYQAEGNLSAAATLLSQIHYDSASELFWVQIQQWMYERRYTEATDVLKNAITKHDRSLTDWQKIHYVSTLALLQQFSGDTAHSRATWQQVRTDVEKLRATKGEEFGLWALVEAYAALGDKTKALATLEHAAASGPVSNDPLRPEITARIAAQAGDKDLAFEQLALSAQNPAGVTYGDLKLNPLWDSLRGDPRFEKIVASLAPNNTER